MPTPPLSAQPPPLSVRICRPDASTILVVPAGEADAFTVFELHQALTQATGAVPTRLVVDLDQLTFMDASVLDALVDAHTRVQSAGGQLRVRCSRGLGRRMLALTGLDGMLEDHAADGAASVEH